MPDPSGCEISEIDLNAYVDGQLDPDRHIEVEAYLQDRPELAAQVMQDLCLRDELRRFLETDSTPMPPAAVAASRQLQRRLRFMTIGLRLRRNVAVAAMIALGWFAHSVATDMSVEASAAQEPPSFVREAVAAYRTVVERMAVDRGEAVLSPGRPSTAASLPLPSLGPSYAVLGTGGVDRQDGKAIQILYRAAGAEPVALFASEVERFAVSAPHVADLDGVTTAYWQNGFYAYALSGHRSQDELMAAASRAASPGS